MKFKSTLAVLFVAGLSLNLGACRWSKKKSSHPKGTGHSQTQGQDEQNDSKEEGQKPNSQEAAQGNGGVVTVTVDEAQRTNGAIVHCTEGFLADIGVLKADLTDFEGAINAARGDEVTLEGLLDRITTEDVAINDFEDAHKDNVCYVAGEKDSTLHEISTKNVANYLRNRNNALAARLNALLNQAQRQQAASQAQQEQGQQAQGQQGQGQTAGGIQY